MFLTLAIAGAGLFAVGYYSLSGRDPSSQSSSLLSSPSYSSSSTDSWLQTFQRVDYDWHHLSLFSPRLTTSPPQVVPANCSSIGFSSDCAYRTSPGSNLFYSVSVSSNLTQAILINVVVNQTVTTHHNSTLLDTTSESQISTSTITVPQGRSSPEAMLRKGHPRPLRVPRTVRGI